MTIAPILMATASNLAALATCVTTRYGNLRFHVAMYFQEWAMQMFRPLGITTFLACWLAMASGAQSASAHDSKHGDHSHGVQITSVNDGESVRITIDGELFTVLQRSARWKKPFFYPVTRPGWSTKSFEAGDAIVAVATPVVMGEGKGQIVPAATKVSVAQQRSIPDVGLAYELPDHGGWVSAADLVPESALVVRTMEDSPLPFDRKNKNGYDHPHHRGIWVAVDEVNGIKFWNEGGQIRPESFEIAGNRIAVRNSWIGENDETLITERTTWTFAPSRLVAAEITFANESSESVTFEDTKEGLFACRVASELREKVGGAIADAEGRRSESNVWGLENRWVDYSGSRVGVPMGVSIFDSSRNPRPGRYHVRGYGLFAINPFGQKAYSKNTAEANHLVLAPTESVTLRYGLWVHGKTSNEQIEAIGGAFSRLVDSQQ